jgi:hypothetical protein
MLAARRAIRPISDDILLISAIRSLTIPPARSISIQNSTWSALNSDICSTNLDKVNVFTSVGEFLISVSTHSHWSHHLQTYCSSFESNFGSLLELEQIQNLTSWDLKIIKNNVLTGLLCSLYAGKASDYT